MLHSQMPWWIGGPVLGLCVVAMRWLMNEHLGVMGAWTDVVHTPSPRAGCRSARSAGCCSA